MTPEDEVLCLGCEAKDREIARLHKCWDESIKDRSDILAELVLKTRPPYSKDVLRITERIRREARASMREEAARVAEKQLRGLIVWRDTTWNKCCWKIAAAIRALPVGALTPRGEDEAGRPLAPEAG